MQWEKIYVNRRQLFYEYFFFNFEYIYNHRKERGGGGWNNAYNYIMYAIYIHMYLHMYCMTFLYSFPLWVKLPGRKYLMYFRVTVFPSKCYLFICPAPLGINRGEKLSLQWFFPYITLKKELELFCFVCLVRTLEIFLL